MVTRTVHCFVKLHRNPTALSCYASAIEAQHPIYLTHLLNLCCCFQEALDAYTKVLRAWVAGSPWTVGWGAQYDSLCVPTVLKLLHHMLLVTCTPRQQLVTQLISLFFGITGSSPPPLQLVAVAGIAKLF